MKKNIYYIGLLIMLVTFAASCTKSSTDETIAATLTQDEKSLVTSAGFNSNWAERTANGSYLIEGDILLTKAQLQEMSGIAPSHNFIVVMKNITVLTMW